MIRVLLADDHPVVRAGYRRLLEQAGDIAVAAEAADGASAYALAVQTPPDVLVTDLSMPGAGGLELIRRLLPRLPALRMLVFSMHDGAALVRQALAAGAHGFVTKASAPEALVDAVRAVHAGRGYLSADLPPCSADDEHARLASLSVREFEIFRLLAQGHSAQACAGALHLSPKTVSNCQSVIKDKLGVATSAALAHLAIRHGVVGSAGGDGAPTLAFARCPPRGRSATDRRSRIRAGSLVRVRGVVRRAG